MSTPNLALAQLLIMLWAIAALSTPNGSCALNRGVNLTQIGPNIGLPGGTVRAVGQDAQGVMWLGTETAGLVSYDGSEFVQYQHDPRDPNTLSSNYVQAVLIDRSNRLWVGTINGLNLFDPSTRRFTRFEEVERTFGDGVVYTVAQDLQGNVWFGSSGRVGCLSPSLEELKVYEAPAMGMTLEYLAIECAADGRIWFGTQRGLFEFDRESGRIGPTQYNAKPAIEGNLLQLNAIAEDKSGMLWLSTEAGVTRYDPGSEDVTTLTMGEVGSRGMLACGDALVDKDGSVWIGTFFDGIRIFDRTTDAGNPDFFRVQVPKELKFEEVRSLFEDRNGLIWIGTKEYGVFFYDRKTGTFPYFPGSVVSGAEADRSSSYVRALTEDHEGILWIGTLHDGILGFDRKTNSYRRLRESGSDETGLLTINTRAALEDSSRALWFGTPEGLLKLGADRETKARFACEPVRDLLESSDRQLYVGTRLGLRVFDLETERFRPFPVAESPDVETLLTAEISTMLEDSDGIIWIGTWLDGLFRFDPVASKVQRYLPEATGLNSKLIRSLTQDSRDDFWVGTKLGGLNRYDKDSDRFESIGLEQGLPFDSVYSIVEDDTGRLWLSMNGGLVRYDAETGEMSTFTKEYGLQSNRFDELNAAIKSASGEVVVGARNGFNIFDPAKIEVSNNISDTLITSVKVLNEEKRGELDGGSSLEIPHDRNYITMSFALTDYTAPKQNEFAYKLEGFDENWFFSGTRNYATYTELPAGRYTFHVKGKSPTGGWSAIPSSLDIVVTPPFWLTRSFVVVSAILVLGGSILLYILQSTRNRWQRKQLERLVEERTEKWQLANRELEESKHDLESKVQERTKDLMARTKDLVAANNRAEEALEAAQKADQLKSAFLANMSHEIRTPMNAILGFSHMLSDQGVSSADKAEFIAAIDSSGHELLTLVDDILDLSSIEAGQVKLVKADVDLNEMFALLHQTYRVALAKQNKAEKIKLLWSNLADSPLYLYTDETRLRQIVSNFLNNAVKFTDEGSIEFGFDIEDDKQWIRFYVRDSGIGIEKDLQDAVFDRFRKIEGVGERLYRGSGLGLSISRNLAILLGGKISVISELGKGSTFTLRLPASGLKRQVEPRPDSAVDQKTESLHLDTSGEMADDQDQAVLIVAEDEESNFQLLKTMLRNEKFTLVRASDGIEAVEASRKYPKAQAVLMDIKMPRMNGIEAARQIRGFNKDVVIIAHTAHALSYERSKIMTSDFNGYLSKPVTRMRLLDCLKHHL